MFNKVSLMMLLNCRITCSNIEPFNYNREDAAVATDKNLHDTAKLPLAIKEKDVEYQFHRIIMFSRLLESYPHSGGPIQKEAAVDVCPLRRGEIWGAMLGVTVNREYVLGEGS